MNNYKSLKINQKIARKNSWWGNEKKWGMGIMLTFTVHHKINLRLKELTFNINFKRVSSFC
jgi:hypothetical protein